MSTHPTHDTALPQPPFFLIPNLNNLRDVAHLPPSGLPVSSPPGRIRQRILFRSADVSKLDRPGWKALKALGVGYVFDLRSKPELDKSAPARGSENHGEGTGVGNEKPRWVEDLEAEGLQRTWVPVFEESDYSPERLAERYANYMGEGVQGFVEAYRDILRNAGPAFRTILLHLTSLAPPPTPPDPNIVPEEEKKEANGILVHCTAGKDRTGIFFGILLSFLGVPAARIADEYQLTELGLAHIRDEVVARLMRTPGVEKYINLQLAGKGFSSAEISKTLASAQQVGAEEESSGRDRVSPQVLDLAREAALRMWGATRETMLQSLKMVEREWGSAEGYLRDVCKLRDEELERLKRVLIVQS